MFVLARIGFRYFIASMKEHWWTVITMSIGLKFFWHRKHLARFVLGLVAVRASLQIGQMNRKYPSDCLQGICKELAIKSDIGIWLRSWKRKSLEIGINPPLQLKFRHRLCEYFVIDLLCLLYRGFKEAGCGYVVDLSRDAVGVVIDGCLHLGVKDFI